MFIQNKCAKCKKKKHTLSEIKTAVLIHLIMYLVICCFESNDIKFINTNKDKCTA